MDRKEKATGYHNQGYNCCQAVAAAFSDVTGLGEAQSLAAGGGFGGGLRCGEICGAVSGAVSGGVVATGIAFIRAKFGF